MTSTLLANPPQNFPLYDECKPCPKVEPADKCPSNQPEAFSKYSTVGHECSYDFRYLRCNLEELQCTPLTFFTCSDENTWEVAVAGIVSCSEETLSISRTTINP